MHSVATSLAALWGDELWHEVKKDTGPKNLSTYFDMADHTLAFTHRAIAEHLYAAGFEPERIEARFLPYSFTGLLPPSPTLTRRYLRTPLAWRLLGKQFLVIGRRP